MDKRIALLDDLFHPDAKPQGNLECFVTSGNDKPRAWTGQSSIPARSSTARELFTTLRFVVEHVGDFLGFPGSDRSERFEEVQAVRVVEGRMKADELAG